MGTAAYLPRGFWRLAAQGRICHYFLVVANDYGRAETIYSGGDAYTETEQRLTERHEHPGGQCHWLRQPAEVYALLSMKQERLGGEGRVKVSEETVIGKRHTISRT